MKIYYVDDAPFTRMLLKRSLEGAGHESWGASSGQEMLVRLEQGLPDLLLTDLLMEGLSGLELLEQVKGLYPDLPVIVVTADVQGSTQTRCKELGAMAVFPKGSLYPRAQALLDMIDGVDSSEEGGCHDAAG